MRAFAVTVKDIVRTRQDMRRARAENARSNLSFFPPVTKTQT
jgi:hypothetical protein